MRTGVPAYRRTGVPAYRRTGVPAYRRTGVPAYRRTGVPAYRRTGVPAFFHCSMTRKRMRRPLKPRVKKIPLRFRHRNRPSRCPQRHNPNACRPRPSSGPCPAWSSVLRRSLIQKVLKTTGSRLVKSFFDFGLNGAARPAGPARASSLPPLSSPVPALAARRLRPLRLRRVSGYLPARAEYPRPEPFRLRKSKARRRGPRKPVLLQAKK